MAYKLSLSLLPASSSAAPFCLDKASMLLNRFECHVEVERKNTSAIYASFFTGYDSTYRPLREWVHSYLFQVLAATDYV